MNRDLSDWLVEHAFPGDDVNAAGEHGLTPLMRAKQGDAAVVAALLRTGADPHAKNSDGNNALWLACVGASADILDVLIAAGIDIDHQNDNGATCLMYAAATGKALMVEALLAAGADTRLKSLDDFTALDMAASLECLHLLRYADRRPVAVDA